MKFRERGRAMRFNIREKSFVRRGAAVAAVSLSPQAGVRNALGREDQQDGQTALLQRVQMKVDVGLYPALRRRSSEQTDALSGEIARRDDGLYVEMRLATA